MKKLISGVCVALVLCLFAQAQETEKKCDKCPATQTTSLAKCEGGECAGECKGECPITKAMAALPKMTYMVGKKETCCSKTAAKIAKETEGHIHFVVAKKQYHDEGKAMIALADTTEKFVKTFATPKKCSKSGMTTVAGQSMHCGESAKKMALIAKSAMDKVHMTYKVGKETCSCPTQAASLAKASGEKKTYLIGKESTCCSVDARIKMAHAKYKAAVQAINKVAAKTAPAAAKEAAAAAQS